MTWDEIVEDNYRKQSTRTADAFKKALDEFLATVLNCDYSRDVQFHYLMHPSAGGGPPCVEQKHIMES